MDGGDADERSARAQARNLDCQSRPRQRHQVLALIWSLRSWTGLPIHPCARATLYPARASILCTYDDACSWVYSMKCFQWSQWSSDHWA